MPQQKEEILSLLSKEPFLKKVISLVEISFPEKKTSVFIYLIRSIISQQLSVKSAESIYARFKDLVGPEIDNPHYIGSLHIDVLRNVGFSNQKATYVKNVCTFFIDKNLHLQDWDAMSDEDFIALLSQIKGVGVWTCQMVLIFALLRNDVFPLGDLGIQQGMQKLYGLKSQKKQLLKEMEDIAKSWPPYRSIASLYLWRYNDLK